MNGSIKTVDREGYIFLQVNQRRVDRFRSISMQRFRLGKPWRWHSVSAHVSVQVAAPRPDQNPGDANERQPGPLPPSSPCPGRPRDIRRLEWNVSHQCFHWACLCAPVSSPLSSQHTAALRRCAPNCPGLDQALQSTRGSALWGGPFSLKPCRCFTRSTIAAQLTPTGTPTTLRTTGRRKRTA